MESIDWTGARALRAQEEDIKRRQRIDDERLKKQQRNDPRDPRYGFNNRCVGKCEEFTGHF
jgi:hypothetical protein